MILRRLVVGGDPQLDLDLHPRLTVLRGLGRHGRARVVAAVRSLVSGDIDAVSGVVELDGVEFEVEPDLVHLLDLPAEPPDVVIRAGDLMRAVGPADENTVTTGNRRAELEELDRFDRFGADASRRGEAAGIGGPSASPATSPVEPDEPADGDHVHDEQGLAGAFVPDRDAWSWATQDPAAPDEKGPIARRIEEIETEIAEVRRRLAEVGDPAAADAGPGVDAFEVDAFEVDAFDAFEVDAGTSGVGQAERVAVSAALEAYRWVRSWRPDTQPEAVALADEAAAVRRERALARPADVPEWLREQARQQLEAAQAEMDRAEREVRPQRVAPEAAAALEAAHTAVDEAEERARRRMAGPMAARKLASARAQEEEILQQLGLPSYAAYLLLRASSGNVDADGERRLSEARAALADAEAMWAEANGTGRDSADSETLREQERAVRAAALELLGPEAAIAVSELTLERLEALLREQRMPAPDWRPAAEGLVEALVDAGADLPPLAFDDYEGDYDQLEDLAALWLARLEGGRPARPAGVSSDDEYHAAERERAALLDDLDGLESELAELQAAAASAPVVFEPVDVDVAVEPVEVEPVEAEAEYEVEVEAPTPLVVAEVEAPVDRPMTAAERLRALRERTTERLDALAAQVGSLVRDVDEPRPDPVPDLADGPAHADEQNDPNDPEAGAVEMGTEIDRYLAGRFETLRDGELGAAAPLPMLVDDALDGLPPGVAEVALGRIADESAAVQVVVLSDDPEVAAWATALAEVGVDAAVVDMSVDDAGWTDGVDEDGGVDGADSGRTDLDG